MQPLAVDRLGQIPGCPKCDAAAWNRCSALRHDTHFMAAKVSTTLRLLTLIMPMPG